MERRERGARMISWVVLAACAVLPEAVLSRDSPGPQDTCTCRSLLGNGTICEFDFETVSELETHDPCCAENCFDNRLAFSNFQKDSLSLSVDYRGRHEATLTIEWQYANLSTCPPDLIPQNPPSPVQLRFSQSGTKRCLCLPPGVTSVRTSLVDPPVGCYNLANRSAVDVSVEVKVNDPYDGHGHHPICNSPSFVSYMSHQEEVRDCWAVVGEQSLPICGVQVPSEPTAVTVLAGDMQLTTNLSVSWSPPTLHNTPIAGYRIDVFTHKNGRPMFNSTVLGNVTQYTFEFDRALRKEDNPFIEIAAGVYSDEGNGLCTEYSVNGRYAVFSRAVSAPVHWPSCFNCAPTLPTTKRTSERISEFHVIAWPLAGAVLLLAAAVMIFIIFVARRKRSRPQSVLAEKGLLVEMPHLPRPVSASSIREQGTVFLAASTEEDAAVKRRIRNLCHVLGENGLTPVYYEYVANDHSEDSPSAMGMNRWVELQFCRCEFVLFVCTKRFMEEWNGERRDIFSPLVYPCRNLLDGSLTRPQNISRFAVLFMGVDRCVPTGLKNFKQFELFTTDSDSIGADRLVCYLLEAPPYAMPKVAACIPMQQFL